jgi:glycogen debranching enzyme
MNIRGPRDEHIPNEAYDRDRYWLGPTWMASNKPVMDGFRSYGYEMLYLYMVTRTASTLQDGRAVEHWDAETGSVNTSNVNFPWTASCIAGSIWEELAPEHQAEYLRRFHSDRFGAFLEMTSKDGK